MKIIIFFVVLSIVLIGAYYLNYLNFLYSFLKYPLQFFGFLKQKITGFLDIILFINKLRQENIALFEQNQKLMVFNKKAIEAQKENEFLRQQLELEQTKQFKLVPASVINKSQFFALDKDIADKPVIIANGILVGQTEKYGKVKLITSSQSTVNALIQETRIAGAVYGDHGLTLIMSLPLQELEIKKGQTVMTSGLEKKFPPGLLIGQIIDVSKNENQNLQNIRIQPFFNQKDLEKVFIIADY